MLIILIMAMFTLGCLCKSPGHSSLESDTWILRYDANGTEIWKTVINGDNNYAMAIGETYDGGVIVSGGQRNYSTGTYLPWLTKIDKNGKVEWNKIFNVINNEKITSIAPDNGTITAISYSGALFRTDLDGNMLWEKRGIESPGWWHIYSAPLGIIAANEKNIVTFDENGDILNQAENSPISNTSPLIETGNNNYIVAYGTIHDAEPLTYAKSITISGNTTWSLMINNSGGWPVLLYQPAPEVYNIVSGDTGAYGTTLNKTVVSHDGKILLTQKIEAHAPIVNSNGGGFTYAGFTDSSIDSGKPSGIIGKSTPLKVVKIDEANNVQWITESNPSSHWHLWYFYYPEPVRREVVSIIQTMDEGYVVLVSAYAF